MRHLQVPPGALTGGPTRRDRLVLLGVAAGVFLVDRLTKVGIQGAPLNVAHPYLGGLVRITHQQNSGAAFSVGLGMGKVFLVLAVVATVAIIYYERRLPRAEILSRVALGMIMGGALGNALDRVLVGSVTDFIDLRFWPVFNAADSSIVVGACLLALRLGGARPQAD